MPRADVVRVQLATGGVTDPGGEVFLGVLGAAAAVSSGAIHLSSPVPGEGPRERAPRRSPEIRSSVPLLLEPPDQSGRPFTSVPCADAVPLFAHDPEPPAREPARGPPRPVPFKHRPDGPTQPTVQ